MGNAQMAWNMLAVRSIFFAIGREMGFLVGILIFGYESFVVLEMGGETTTDVLFKRKAANSNFRCGKLKRRGLLSAKDCGVVGQRRLVVAVRNREMMTAAWGLETTRGRNMGFYSVKVV